MVQMKGASKMKTRPTWATIVGVLGIIASSFGILAGSQTIIMPKMLKIQKQMFSEMAKQTEKKHAETTSLSGSSKANMLSMNSGAMLESMNKMWDLPKWYNTWSVVTGLLQLFFSGFYLFTCIWLLQIKPASIKMFYFAAGAKILHGIINGIVAAMASSFMMMTWMVAGIFGIVIHIVLLIVVATGNKKAFLSEVPQT